MALYKEIVTKAVIGKGKKHYKNTYTITTDNKPDTVLGCWIINHKFSGAQENNKVVINGSFDVNLWYSYNNNTKTTVITKTINYKELVSVNIKEKTDTDIKDIVVRSLKQPTCVGDTKVKIAIEEDDDAWDIIDDEYDEETSKEIDNNVKEDYIS